MTPPNISLNFIDVLKYGAIGISLVCLLTAFWTNQSLAKSAPGLSEDALARLLAHSRWTMKFSFACLVAAIAVEGISHFYIPIMLHVGIVPSTLASDARQMHSLKNVSEPIRLQVGAETQYVTLTNGSGEIRVAPNATILVYVDGMWSTMKDLDGIVYGQQQRTAGRAGTLEPKQ